MGEAEAHHSHPGMADITSEVDRTTLVKLGDTVSWSEEVTNMGLEC